MVVTGELAIRKLTVGSSESTCEWSTTSCNEMIAMMKQTRTQLLSILRTVRLELIDFLESLGDLLRKFGLNVPMPSIVDSVKGSWQKLSKKFRWKRQKKPQATR